MNRAFIKKIYKSIYEDQEQEICGKDSEYKAVDRIWRDKIREYDLSEEVIEVFNEKLLKAMELAYIKGAEDYSQICM